MITRVAVSLGGTINLGNYENVKVEYVVESTYSDDELFETHITYLEERLAEKFKAFKENVDKNFHPF